MEPRGQALLAHTLGSHTLIAASPWPLGPRLADLTRDGHVDILVHGSCANCNHGAAAVSVFATLDGKPRRIYGNGFVTGPKGDGPGIRGRVIFDTAWGALRGLLWFDQPDGHWLSSDRIQTFLRWNGRRFAVVERRRVPAENDPALRGSHPG